MNNKPGTLDIDTRKTKCCQVVGCREPIVAWAVMLKEGFPPGDSLGAVGLCQKHLKRGREKGRDKTMRVLLQCQRGKEVIKGGEHLVEEVELTSDGEALGYLTIKLSDRQGTVKMTDLQSALKAFEKS